MIRNGLIATCIVGLLIAGADRAHALDPSKRLTQYRHTVWRVQDGFFSGAPSSVSQTADGYMWVITWSGVFRFDGARFVPWSPPASSSKNIYLFVPAKKGGFWINDGLGISHIQGSRIVSHIKLKAPPGHIVEEADGSLWVTTFPRPNSPGVLCHATDRQAQCFGKADGLPIQISNSILPDGTGGFWMGSDTSLVHWKAGASEIYAPQALKSGSGQEGIFGLARDSDGSLWVGMPSAGRGLGLERFRDGSFKPFSAPNFDGTKISVRTLLLDRDGNLWVGTENDGLYRIHGNNADHFGSADGLSGNSVKNLFEDQEGIIWAATSNGLDSFREPRVTTYSELEGLGAGGALSVTVSHDGTVWLASNESLDSVHNGTVVSIGTKDGLPGNTATSLLEDRQGHLWVGVDDRLYIYEDRHFRPFPSPDRRPIGMIVGMTEDIDGNIWAECASKPRKLIRIRDFKVQEEFSDSQVPPGHSLAADPKGGIWIGTLDGRLVHLQKGKVDIFPMNLQGDLAVRQIEVQPDGSVMAAAIEDGLIRFHAGVVERLNKQNGLPCSGVFGFNRDDRGNWWISTQCGYLELAASEIQKWRANPKAVLQFRLLDALDGARTGRSDFNPAAKSPDGRLWFVGAEVAQTIEPSRIEKVSTPRPIYVESVTADHKQYVAQDGLKLPVLTHDLQIDYTSPSFAVAQKVKFRYRLEGSNNTWQDADSRRQAFYSNLGPGQYRFTVIASNEDGVWNTQGATLQFSITPAWFQTIWFRTLLVIAFLGLLWSFYWIRLRRIQSQFNVILETQLSERTRIINTIPALAWSAGRDGAAEFFNQRWVDYTGLSADQSCARGWMSAIHPDDVKAVGDHCQSSLTSGKAMEVEARVCRRDGAYRWFLFRTDPLRDKSGTVIKFYGTITDIEDNKRLEETLRANELSLRQIVDNIPGFVHTTSAMGEIEFISRQTLEFYGKTREELKDWSRAGIVHPDDLPPTIEAWRKSIETGQDIEVEHRNRRADGVYRWIQARGRAVRNQKGEINAWYWLLTDIDDRKKAEEALQSNERNLGLIINTMPTLAWSARPDGSAEFLNQHYVDYIGLPLEKLQGWGWTVAVHPDDLDALSGAWQSIMAVGKPAETEARLRRSDGEFRWFLFRTNPMRDESGQIVKWYGTNTDIHDRKRAEAEVKESYLRLAEAQRLSKTGSFITDLVADDHNWSEETFRIFEFAPGTKVTVQMIRNGIHPEDVPSFDAMIARAIMGKDVDFSFRFVTSGGVMKHIRGMARVIEHIVGRPLFIGALQDVTDSKMAEEALNRARSDLAHVSRVTTLNALTASIAHEINQPLSGIVTNANTCLWLLSTDPPDIAGARETAQLTIRDGNRASDVIERLRTLYGKKESRPESMDLNEATREVISLSLSDLQRNGVIVHHELADDLPLVTGDRIQLQQVILNLVRNASEAMSTIDDRQRELLVKTEREEANRVRLSVKDVGVGFQQQAANKLFEAFYTTKEHGMGIGLHVCRSIIEAHHGRLWATANDGHGATFSFAIPCSLSGAKARANLTEEETTKK